jgi:LysM repeat protein
MIESQTEVPAQEDGPEKIRAKAQEVRSTVASQLQASKQALAGTKKPKYLNNVGRYLGDVVDRLQLGTVLTQVMQSVRAGAGDGPLVQRYALHLVVIFLALAIILVGQMTVPELDFRLAAPTPPPVETTDTVITPPTNRGGGRFVPNNSGFFQAPVPHTIVAERDRMEIITYTVQANDNVWSIANGFGLQVETLVWANPEVERAPDLLSVGQVLTILPVDGVYHTVQSGDTVDKLAKDYKTEVDKITAFELNGLEEPYALTPGQKLVLPGGRKKAVVANYYPMTRVGAAPPGAIKGSGQFAWPAKGWLSQRYWSGHPAIDIANRTGTPILAADAGYVVMAGRGTWGYGNQVVIDHGNGFQTRYAHLHTLGVQAGQSVDKNQQIGTMGSTGRSTGPHLHFEVIQAGARRNPQGYLP